MLYNKSTTFVIFSFTKKEWKKSHRDLISRSEQQVQAPNCVYWCCLALPKQPKMQMQRLSFAHTSAIRAYCQLYYCENYTIEYALSPVLVSGAFLFSVTFEILHLYTTAAMYVVYTTDSIYTVACTVEIELHKRSHISFFGQLDSQIKVKENKKSQ